MRGYLSLDVSSPFFGVSRKHTDDQLAAVVRYYNDKSGREISWSQLVGETILEPLNMTHTFFGAVPQHLIPDIGIPGGENWADLLVGSGYDPVAGMWVRIQVLVVASVQMI